MNNIQIELLISDLIQWADKYNNAYNSKPSEKYLRNALSRCLKINEDRLVNTIYTEAKKQYQKDLDKAEKINNQLESKIYDIAEERAKDIIRELLGNYLHTGYID